MCGFAGIYKLDNQNFQIQENILQNMNKKITHRGPDAADTRILPEHGLGLAFSRLSIIDLSASGMQPMMDHDRSVILVFNGEIYNYQKLKKELALLGHHFQANSDTEVIIAAYKQWGIDGLRHLDGMFAIALYDIKNRELYLIRDRIGVKPLYFSLQNGILAFASEIKAFDACPWIKKRISSLAKHHYLTFMVTPAPFTIFDQIYKLPAGFYCKIDRKKEVSFQQWYNPVTQITSAEKRGCQSEALCVEKIRELLDKAIEKRMIADVPVGAFLSGGLDSSLNVALMSRFSSNIKTFTMAFSDGAERNELQWARQISQKFGTDHHEIIISEKEAFEFYQQMVYQLDEPLADCVCVPFYYVALSARTAGMKVVQVGEGADELFFGYPVYGQYAQLDRQFWQPTQKFVPSFIKKSVGAIAFPFVKDKPFKQELLYNWSQGKNLFWSGALAFGEKQKSFFTAEETELGDPIVEKIYPGLSQISDSHSIVQYHLSQLKTVHPEADFYQQMLYLELKQRLPELLLMRADKMSMATSIEARVPFLDYKLVEALYHIPGSLKFKNNTTKYLLKKAAEGIIPNDIIYRKKIGFGAPTFRWLGEGKYFPAYFAKQQTKLVNESMNKNTAHRAVQNWVLQQMETFRNLHN